MAVTIVGDFVDPLSFLASQRVEQITSLGLHDIRWLAVEADPGRDNALRWLADRLPHQASTRTVERPDLCAAEVAHEPAGAR